MGECLQLRIINFFLLCYQTLRTDDVQIFYPLPRFNFDISIPTFNKGVWGGGRCLTTQVFCWTLVKGRVSTALSKIVDFLEQLIFIFMHQDTFSNA